MFQSVATVMAPNCDHNTRNASCITSSSATFLQCESEEFAAEYGLNGGRFEQVGECRTKCRQPPHGLDARAVRTRFFDFIFVKSTLILTSIVTYGGWVFMGKRRDQTPMREEHKSSIVAGVQVEMVGSPK